ncbi:CAP domain-containing protein [Sphingomonas sp. 28-63-12]|uniref:CAP domain-containing protein n=1 Tax=Sphingomonas sp. 28-63-12 TaxID=1970434 RepID=UPI000BC40F3E|nr:MAG: hypothetical protein B7Y47_10750 [Sphingomonas sp. 28-63-12]
MLVQTMIAMMLALGLAPAPSPAVAPGDSRSDPRLNEDVLAELNRARADPQGYADELRAYRDDFDGPVAYSREAPDGVMTHEGPAAVDDAIAFLNRQPGLDPLNGSAMLALGAGALVIDQAAGTRIGHVTLAGLDPSARMRQHGGNIYVGEVIAYGQADPRSVVRQLIVDDGVARRGHRALVFSTLYRFAGVECGPHGRYGAMCVIDLSATPDGSPKIPGSTPQVAALSDAQ